MKHLETFKSKTGKEIKIILPTFELINQLLEFINRLVEEDTYLNLSGKPKTINDEKVWLKSSIDSMNCKKSSLIWAFYNDRIIGNCEVVKQRDRSAHVGKIGLMIDRDFRREGLGEFMLKMIIASAKKELKLKTLALEAFLENEPAISLYKKAGFKEFGRLPSGLFRRNRYSDEIFMYRQL